MFIVIDGIDGAGKSTQIRKLKAWFESLGRNVECTLEPGGTSVGKKIRSVLLNAETRLEADTEMLLFCADRAEHQLKIRKLLADGVDVLCDRFLSSTWAYQIYGRKLNAELLEVVTEKTVSTYPDLTIILDLSAPKAIERSQERLRREGKELVEGRFEREQESFFYDVQDGFRAYAAQDRFGQCVLIDASVDEDEVFAAIQQEVQRLLQ